MRSLPIGHGATLVQGRFMKLVKREHMMADWFADLDLGQLQREKGQRAHVSTTWTWPAIAVASSLSRWGRLPVFSSWRMVATTTSSFMPSVSTLMVREAAAASEGGGDGGGVWAARDGRGRAGLAGDGAGAASLCDLFNFLEGGGRAFGEDVVVVAAAVAAAVGEDGCSGAAAVAPAVLAAVELELVADGGGRCDEGRGTWMPNRLRFTLLRRVLYAMGEERKTAEGRRREEGVSKGDGEGEGGGSDGSRKLERR